jgi:hypothetical protein
MSHVCILVYLCIYVRALVQAINHNPIVYSFMTEMAYNNFTTGISEGNALPWTEEYATRRYDLGAIAHDTDKYVHAMQAWKLLLDSSYSGSPVCYQPTCSRRR